MDKNSTRFYKYSFPTLGTESSIKNEASSSSSKVSEFEKISQQQNAKVLNSSKDITTLPPVPQGLGEIKHSYLPKKSLQDTSVPARKVKGITEAIILTNEKMFDNIDDFFFKPPEDTRSRLENEVRKRKIAHLRCPFTDNNHRCSVLSIRCGDRAQFAYPENREQRNLPHNCLYKPSKEAEYTLIVESDEKIRNFCKTSLEIFFHVGRDKIEVAATGNVALEILKQFKLHGKRCGLLVCSQNLVDMAGHHVISEVFNRNYNTDVLLTWDEEFKNLSDEDSNALSKMVTSGDIIKGVIIKPFHSDTFIEAVKKIKQDRFEKKSI